MSRFVDPLLEFCDNAKFYQLSIASKNAFRYKQIHNKNYQITKYIVPTGDCTYTLHDIQIIYGGGILRISTFSSNKNLALMDFVQRYVYKSEEIEYVKINDERLLYRDTNKYHQYSVNSVDIKMQDSYTKIKSNAIRKPFNLNFVMYARDYKNSWIIHSRLLPNSEKIPYLQLNSVAGLRFKNTFLMKFLKISGLFKPLQYASERKSQLTRSIFFRLLKPNIYFYALVKKNTLIAIQSELSTKCK